MVKIMISAGEASGDLHGANLAKAIKSICPEAELFGMGGAKMADAGVEILQGIDELGVIGLFASLGLVRKLFKIRDAMLSELKKREADVLVVIDYPEYNTRFAKKVYEMGIPVVFFISPSAWAWRKGRAKDVAQISDRVASIFPFEAEVYRDAGANVTYVGHPLVDIVKPSLSSEEARIHFEMDPMKKQILLMPGSRRQEIETLLPPMMDAAEILVEKDPNLEFFLPLASTISRKAIETMTKGKKAIVRIVEGDAYDLMSVCQVGIIGSGTATLEAALLHVPSVIVYQVSPMTYWLGRKLVKLNHFGLPNIVAQKEILPELIQKEVTGEKIAEKLSNWLYNEKEYQRVLESLSEMKEKLGRGGAVRRTAEVVLEVAKEKRK